jgi:hypothetical protein
MSNCVQPGISHDDSGRDAADGFCRQKGKKRLNKVISMADRVAVFRLSLLSEGNLTSRPPRYANLGLLASRPLHSNLFKQELHGPSTSLFKVPGGQHRSS